MEKRTIMRDFIEKFIGVHRRFSNFANKKNKILETIDKKEELINIYVFKSTLISNGRPDYMICADKCKIMVHSSGGIPNDCSGDEIIARRSYSEALNKHIEFIKHLLMKDGYVNFNIITGEKFHPDRRLCEREQQTGLNPFKETKGKEIACYDCSQFKGCWDYF